MLEVLIKEAREKKLFSCPVFNDGSILGVFIRLPDEIHIDDKKWVKKYRIRETENGPVKIPYGIDYIKTEYKEKDIPEFTNNFKPIPPDGLSDNELANWYIELHKKGLI